MLFCFLPSFPVVRSAHRAVRVFNGLTVRPVPSTPAAYVTVSNLGGFIPNTLRDFVREGWARFEIGRDIDGYMRSPQAAPTRFRSFL